MTTGRGQIWISRPEPGAARTARRLAELGHDALVAPVLSIAPTGSPPPPGPFDGVILTSAHGIRPLTMLDLSGIPVFAVGTRSAERARAAGLGPVHDADGDAVLLARLIAAHLPPGSALLHAAGEDRKPEPEASLRRAGYRIAVWPAYAARALTVLPEPVRRALTGEPDIAPIAAALHYSRRSAVTAQRLCQRAGLSGAFGALAHYCLSADVAKGLVELDVPAHFVAARPTEEDLLAGLVAPS